MAKSYVRFHALSIGNYVYDPETELYYLRNRYYNAVRNQFVTADKLIKGNIYTYCNNQPVTKKDPNGLSGTKIIPLAEEEEVYFEEVEKSIKQPLPKSSPFPNEISIENLNDGQFYVIVPKAPSAQIYDINGTPCATAYHKNKITDEFEYFVGVYSKNSNSFYLYCDDTEGIGGANSFHIINTATYDQFMLGISDLRYYPDRKSSSSYVKNLQKRLNEKNNASLIVNGVFNEQTLYELMVYQKRIGLTDDGVVGPLTREALYEYHPW